MSATGNLQDESETYFTAVSDLLDTGGLAVTRTCVGRCPECGTAVADMNESERYEHGIWTGTLITELGSDQEWLTEPNASVVVVGCEGYWTINPAWVGIVRPNWQPDERKTWHEVEGCWITADLSLVVDVDEAHAGEWILRDLSGTRTQPEDVAHFPTAEAAMAWADNWDRPV